MHYPGWRRTLRRELAWLLALKAAALALLWWLFFSPAHRPPVDAPTESRRFALTRAPLAAPPTAHSRGGKRSD